MKKLKMMMIEKIINEFIKLNNMIKLMKFNFGKIIKC